MKKVLALILCIAMICGLAPYTMAAPKEIIITTEDISYKEEGQWHGSLSLLTEEGVPTRYAIEAGMSASWTPTITIPGEYEILIWKVIHPTSNAKTAECIVKSATGEDKIELDIINGESEYFSLGTYQLEPGTDNYVKVTSITNEGFTRVGSVKFKLTKQTGEEVVPDYNIPLGDQQYAERGVRKLLTKDVYVPEGNADAVNIFVKHGANGDGTSKDSPLGSLEEAQAKVREIISEGYPEKGIVVQMMGGTYSLKDTLTFTSADSGKEGNPVIWKAYNDETVTVTTGQGINVSDFKTVTDDAILKRLPENAQGKVMEIDLRTVGIEYIEETNFVNKAPYQLIVGDTAQITAKWPNVGYGRTGTVKDAASRMDSGPRKKGFTYDLNEARSIRWETATDAWLSGFWLMEYTMDYTKVTDVDSNMMTISGKHPTVWGSGGDARYYICNLLEEIDMPSEFFLDTNNLKLYYYPIEGFENNNVILATSSTSIIKFDTSKNIIFRDAIIEGSGFNGVEFGSSSKNNMIAGGAIRNVAKYGAHIFGVNNGIRDCDIYSTGGVGVSINGGNLKTTEPASNYIENCSIHDVGLTSTSKQGITYAGVGHKILNNHLYNIPHQGITGSTYMDIKINNNIIERTNYELDDAAAIYVTFSGFGYGTEINNNLIVDGVGIMEGEGGSTGGFVHGIYLDNGTGGAEVKDNIVINANHGFYNNYGRDIVLSDNIFINTLTPIQFAIWGNAESKGFAEDGELNVNIKNYLTDEFKAKFPNAHNSTTMSDQPNHPKYNVITNNLSIGQTKINYNECAHEGGKTEGNESVIDITNPTLDIQHDYNLIREKYGKSTGEIVGNYIGGLRKNETAPILDNRADPFVLNYPENGAENIDPLNINLMWSNEKGGIVASAAYIAEDPEMKKVVAVEGTIHSSVTTNLDYGKTYYWRVSATPKFGYADRWNEGGVYKFSTISAEDKVESLSVLANELMANVNITDERKDALVTSMNNTKEALKGDDYIKLYNAIEDFKEKIDAYQFGAANKDELSILIYDDFTLDTIGERPMGLFLRSYSPLDVTAQTDGENTYVRIDDDLKQSTMYGHRVFANQTSYLEVGAKVMRESDEGSFALSLKKTDADIVATGVYNNTAAKIVFGDDGIIYGDRAKTVKLMPYENGKWYNVKMCVDLAKGTYDAYVNNELKASGIPVTDDVTSVNQVIVDSSDGTTEGAAHTGIFRFDDMIVKGPKSTGRNSFLKSIKVNGVEINSFAADKFIYQTELSKDELTVDSVEYVAPETAHVIKSQGDGKVFITVFSGDYCRANVYTLKSK